MNDDFEDFVDYEDGYSKQKTKYRRGTFSSFDQEEDDLVIEDLGSELSEDSYDYESDSN